MAAKKSKGVQKKVSATSSKQTSKLTTKGKVTAKKTASKTGALSAVSLLAGAKSATGKTVKKAAVNKVTLKKTTATPSAEKKITAKKPASRTGVARATAPSANVTTANVSVPNATAKKTRAVGSKSRAELPSVNLKPPTANSALSVGDQIPEFDVLDQSGQKVSNRDWAGAAYVLYFYPKDDTPGCTTQACGFRDELPSFEELGVKVIGCSPDSPNAHTRFAQKYGLQFTLLADIEKDLAQLFGVWKLKQNYGREYMGVERSTFLVDKDGRIARQWRGVRVAGHVPEVLQAVRELS